MSVIVNLARRGMKSPGYKTTPVEPNYSSRIDPAWLGSPAIDGRAGPEGQGRVRNIQPSVSSVPVGG
ncbi:MAG: hypothetical protein HUU38_27240 [Anaerolineales bacterium]|nr:hypothetical protein [Anaerolineales bacterium]